MSERKPHKWAEVIKAWADGKTIQFRVEASDAWTDYDPGMLKNSNASALFYPFNIPRFDQFEWRVKSENIVFEECVYPVQWISPKGIEAQLGRCNGSTKGTPNLRLEFDPDTKNLVKAEVIDG